MSETVEAPERTPPARGFPAVTIPRRPDSHNEICRRGRSNIFRDMFLVRMHKSHRTRAKQATLAVDHEFDVPFLLYPRGTVLRVLIDRFFKEVSVSPQVVMEAEDTEAIKRLVESGFGYSIIPEHALRQRTPLVQTYRVDGHPITRGLALAMVRTDYPRKLTVSIAESLRAMLTA